MPSANLEHVTGARRKGSARTPSEAVSGTKIARPSSTLTLIHSANHAEVRPVSRHRGHLSEPTEGDVSFWILLEAADIDATTT